MIELEAKLATPWRRTDFYVELLPSLTGTKRKRIFGPTPNEAERRARAWLQERRILGPLQDISTGHRALVLRYSDILTLSEMEAAFARAAGDRVTQATVKTAMDEYLLEKKAVWTPVTRERSTYAHERFRDKFATRPVASLKPRELADFLSAQGRSAPNYRRWINAFLNWCHRIAEYTDRNPLVNVQRVEIPRQKKQVFTPVQMKRLLDSAKDHHPTLALCILGGLAGLRYSECLRATWSHLKGRTLHIPNMKTQKRGTRERYIELSDSAMAWLALIPRGKPKERIVQNNEANSRKNRARIRKEARLSWPKNVLRRSYGSHHIAAYENADQTAKIMGHTSAEETYADYYCAIPKRQGMAWIAIFP